MPSKEEYWRNPEKHRAAANKYRLEHPDWKKKAAELRAIADYIDRETGPSIGELTEFITAEVLPLAKKQLEDYSFRANPLREMLSREG